MLIYYIMDELFSENDLVSILEELGVKKMSKFEKLKRLKSNMTLAQFSNMKREVEQATDEDKKMDIIFRNVRQHGTPFKVKKRLLNLGKYSRLDGREIDHYGIFFEKSGILYHYLPTGVRYGEKEYNREICSYYEWKPVLENLNKAYFTLMEHWEIEDFVNRWENKFEYDALLNSSQIFVAVLSYWLR